MSLQNGTHGHTKATDNPFFSITTKPCCPNFLLGVRVEIFYKIKQCN